MMWTIIVSLVLSVLVCLSFIVGIGRRLPNLAKGFQIGFFVTAAVPTVMLVVELIMHQFNRPGFFIMHLVAAAMVILSAVGIGIDKN